MKLTIELEAKPEEIEQIKHKVYSFVEKLKKENRVLDVKPSMKWRL